MALSIVEGWTQRIHVDLADGKSVFPLTGMTVRLIARSKKGTLLTLLGDVGIEDADNGVVYFDPAPGDLLSINSPMATRWEVTDGAGRKAFFPADSEELWTISVP